MLPKAIKNVTREDLEKDNPDLLNNLINEGAAKLTSELNILRFGIKMNKVELAEQLIKEGKSELDAKTAIVEAKSEDLSTAREQFKQSAPPAAGAGSATEASQEIDTQEKAIQVIMKRDNLTNRSEAIRRARREFSGLFVSKFLTQSQESK